MAKLHFNYGAMNGGKSTRLIQTAFNYEEHGGRVVVAKAALDTKGGDRIKSRAGNMSREADVLITPDMDLFEEVESRQISNRALSAVLIDEAQFLTVSQAEQAYRITAEQDIPVIAYGLRRDFADGGFPGAIRLMLLADELKEIPTMCSTGCERKGRSNFRKLWGKYVFEGDQIAIDDEDSVEYVSLCKGCATAARAEEGLGSI